MKLLQTPMQYFPCLFKSSGNLFCTQDHTNVSLFLEFVCWSKARSCSYCNSCFYSNKALSSKQLVCILPYVEPFSTLLCICYTFVRFSLNNFLKKLIFHANNTKPRNIKSGWSSVLMWEPMRISKSGFN